MFFTVSCETRSGQWAMQKDRHQRHSYKYVLETVSTAQWIGIHSCLSFTFYCSCTHTLVHETPRFPFPLLFKFQHALHSDKLLVLRAIPLHNSLIINVLHLGKSLKEDICAKENYKETAITREALERSTNSLEVSSTQQEIWTWSFFQNKVSTCL